MCRLKQWDSISLLTTKDAREGEILYMQLADMVLERPCTWVPWVLAKVERTLVK